MTWTYLHLDPQDRLISAYREVDSAVFLAFLGGRWMPCTQDFIVRSGDAIGSLLRTGLLSRTELFHMPAIKATAAAAVGDSESVVSLDAAHRVCTWQIDAAGFAIAPSYRTYCLATAALAGYQTEWQRLKMYGGAVHVCPAEFDPTTWYGDAQAVRAHASKAAARLKALHQKSLLAAPSGNLDDRSFADRMRLRRTRRVG